MNNRERFQKVIPFRNVDRVPNVEIGYWEETLKRWQKEGLPATIPMYAAEGDLRYSRHSKEVAEYLKVDGHNSAYCVRISGEPEPAVTSESIAEDNATKTVCVHRLGWLQSNV